MVELRNALMETLPDISIAFAGIYAIWHSHGTSMYHGGGY